MLKMLITKEIAATVFDLRFVVATLLCVVLIPLGMYVSRKDYEGRLARYQREHAAYRQRHGTGVHGDLKTLELQGFRPPSPRSVFASGVDPYLPDKMRTSRFGLFSTDKETQVGNPHALLFGKADFRFSIAFVMSLVALIFSFSAVSGEREAGTLRLAIANAVPRSKILLSKIVGIYLALLIPLTLSVLMALLVLEASPDISIVSPQTGPALLAILAVTCLFLLAMVNLGLCLSALTRRATHALVLAFFAWAILVLGVPKVSPMIADVFHPVESAGTLDFRKRLIAEDIDRALVEETDILSKKCYAKYGLRTDRASSAEDEVRKKAEAEIEQGYLLLAERYQRRLAEELRRIEQDYRGRTKVRSALAMHLSRLSPACCYTYVVCGLSGTGVSEPENFLRNAQRYQDRIKQDIYDQVTFIRTRGVTRPIYAEGFDFRTASVPDMVYTYPTLATTLQETWPDILLLGLFTVLFGVVAFMKLNRYDVR